MLVKTKAIVLSAIKYQEKSLIVKCYTQNHGIKSYFVPSAFSSKKSNQRIAYFQPLTLLEIEATHKNMPNITTMIEERLNNPAANKISTPHNWSALPNCKRWRTSSRFASFLLRVENTIIPKAFAPNT